MMENGFITYGRNRLPKVMKVQYQAPVQFGTFKDSPCIYQMLVLQKEYTAGHQHEDPINAHFFFLSHF